MPRQGWTIAWMLGFGVLRFVLKLVIRFGQGRWSLTHIWKDRQPRRGNQRKWGQGSHVDKVRNKSETNTWLGLRSSDWVLVGKIIDTYKQHTCHNWHSHQQKCTLSKQDVEEGCPNPVLILIPIKRFIGLFPHFFCICQKCGTTRTLGA